MKWTILFTKHPGVDKVEFDTLHITGNVESVSLSTKRGAFHSKKQQFQIHARINSLTDD